MACGLLNCFSSNCAVSYISFALSPQPASSATMQPARNIRRIKTLSSACHTSVTNPHELAFSLTAAFFTGHCHLLEFVTLVNYVPKFSAQSETMDTAKLEPKER